MTCIYCKSETFMINNNIFMYKCIECDLEVRYFLLGPGMQVTNIQILLDDYIMEMDYENDCFILYYGDESQILFELDYIPDFNPKNAEVHLKRFLKLKAFL